IKVYQNLADFDQSLKFSSWIYRIAHNQVISNHRYLSARPQVLEVEEDDFLRIADDLELTQELNHVYQAENIAQILTQLSEVYRSVLVLKFWEDRSYEEIADILQKPAGTIASLIHKAKKEFKTQYSLKFLNSEKYV
ncbi:MAG TPA: RNA polymerase sigma factor, partial [Candidatus Gracilibacteria bacterium]|nr:RNA polymerase sigma factor [Candidatus Gracilibacteria bacterium]